MNAQTNTQSFNNVDEAIAYLQEQKSSSDPHPLTIIIITPPPH